MSTLHIAAGMPAAHSLNLFIGSGVKLSRYLLGRRFVYFYNELSLKYPAPISVSRNLETKLTK